MEGNNNYSYLNIFQIYLFYENGKHILTAYADGMGYSLRDEEGPCVKITPNIFKIIFEASSKKL